MRYLSVCSGIEAASVAFEPLGWQCAGLSEIEPFPRKVLAHRYPQVPLHGDFTRIQADDVGPVRLLVGGTPCQAFSVAGRRLGLDDPRGNLAIEYLALARRLGVEWLLWENVPGVLSSNGGRDFGAFLGLLGELGYGWAYRVLDAQYFGVPQRRRRVFVVACAGGAWQRAAAVLFERESLRGDSAPRRQAGQGAASTLTASSGEDSGKDGIDGRVIAHTLRGDGFDAGEDGTGRGTPLVPMTFSAKHTDARATMDMAPTLDCGGGGGMGMGMSVQNASGVRRLTPRECERLQGFPDDWTAIPGAADGPRYKAIGNSMAVPVMRWIGQRIAMVDAL